MNLFILILAATIQVVFFFFLIRLSLRVYLNSILKKRQRKSLQKNQTFVEWFFYKRYLDVLPKYKLWWYYGNFAVYFILVPLAIVCYYTNLHDLYLEIFKSCFFINCLLLVSSNIGR